MMEESAAGRQQWSYPLPLEPLRASLERRCHRLERDRSTARRALDSLLALEPTHRATALAAAGDRHCSPALVDLLLDESRKRLHGAQVEARELAHLAFEVARSLATSRYGNALPRVLLTRALAHEANALRASGDLLGAQEQMETALEAVAHSADPLLRAEVLSLAASLRKDQRRFTQAEEILDEVVRIYSTLGDDHLVGRALLKKASLFYDQGESTAAITVLRESVARLDADREPRLVLCARHNLATYLWAAGRPDEAETVLAASAPLYNRFPDRWTTLRRRWLEGRIAYGLGRQEVAERALWKVHAGFVADGIGYDAALVALDLALLFAGQGRVGDLKRIATEMLALFQAQDVQREAMGALILFQRAAESEAVTVGMVSELSKYLDQLRRDPASRVPRRPS